MRLDVGPGLYALRYVGSADSRTAPSAVVRPASASVDVISVPGMSPGGLAAPGSSVVIVASASGAIEISITAFEGSQNLDARFSLDLLGTAGAPRLSAPQALGRHVAPSSVEGGARRVEGSLELVAHVARRGNVAIDEEGWIAGPRAPSSIEALQIQVRNCDLGVAAQFRNVESRAAWSAWLTPGAVIGVAQRACALTGVRLKLVGAESDRYELVGEALFLGTPRMSIRGPEVEFIAPGELDPLIGVKLSIVGRAVAHPPHVSDKPSRVRVFR